MILKSLKILMIYLRYSTFKQKQEKLIEKIKNDIEKI